MLGERSRARLAQAATQELLDPAADTAPDGADHVALARLHGAPLFDLPQDLYIPPDALEVFLEAFEGPLDLLLYLIRKQHFDVLDIPMAELTRQYLAYVQQVRDTKLELAAQYLLMAAMLIEIKSRMLLPPRPPEPGAEPEDPRAELVRRLLEYERTKLAAQALDGMAQQGRDFWLAHADAALQQKTVLAQVSVADLQAAWQAIMRRAALNTRHRITREQLSVREHMSHILQRLSSAQFMEFTDLFMERIEQGAPPAVVVVHFLALLELCREALVEITQVEAFAPLYVRLGFSRSS